MVPAGQRDAGHDAAGGAVVSMTDEELHANRKAQDWEMGARHRNFDLAAKDTTPKYHRFHFAVVGEGSREARERFRRNYDLINWGN